jgi:hypothetical protein
MSQTGYTTKDGTALPYGSWYSVGRGFEIQPLRTTYNVRHVSNKKVHRPSGPAGRDNLMMALYYRKIPNYVFHAFERWLTSAIPNEEVY